MVVRPLRKGEFEVTNTVYSLMDTKPTWWERLIYWLCR